MQKGNALIIAFCGLVVLAELSSPGQLTFAFPFLSAPKEQLSKFPESFDKMQKQVMEKVEAEAATTAPPSTNPSPQPSPDSVLSEQDREELKNILAQ